MFRHIVLFTWKDGTPASAVDAVVAALEELPEAIPGILEYRFGADARVNEGNADFAVMARFATEDDYLAYRDHPRHNDVVTRLISPHLAARTAVQFASEA